MKTSVKLLLAFATAAAAIAPAAAQQGVAWDEAYRQADARIAQLTLDEKISFMRGYSSFFFYGVPEKGMPYIYLSDATQGVHMRDNLSDPTMVRQLERSTAFPCPISLAATFNPSLAYRYAEAVGEECRAGGIEVLLGPGMNIYRNSQNGRNFEYMGEDPLLASAMVAEYVKGMQSTGTVACLKHFICNETEFYRRRSNSIVDERALHELYLPPFKAGIDAGVGYVMTSYNRLNGEWAGQNADLIRRILRGELGFRGCVMSDWSSVNDTEKVVKSGQNVEMPGRKEFFGEVRALLKEGRITEKDIEKMIRPNIATSIAFGLYDREKYVPALLEKFPAHKQTGYDVAAEGIVLLRNNGILPLAEGRKILLTGRFTEQIPRTGGSTSSSAEVLGYDNVTLTAALREVYGDAVRVVEKPSREELAAADKRATAMLLNAKNRAASFLQKLYDRAGTKPEYQAMALSDFYSEDGIHLPRMAFQNMKQTYDKGAIAEKLGVYSKASGGKVPHAQAIGAIISTLDISEDERERLPYCNNGHDGVDYQYTESVVEKVRAWIEAHGRPSPITVNGKNYAVVYKKE